MICMQLAGPAVLHLAMHHEGFELYRAHEHHCLAIYLTPGSAQLNRSMDLDFESPLASGAVSS
jgi:hypothetical protein